MRLVTSLSVTALCAVLFAGCGGAQRRDDPSPPPRRAEAEPEPAPRQTTRRSENLLDPAPAQPRPAPREAAPPPRSAPAVTLTVNRGASAGIAVGETYDLFTPGEALVDPDTGEVLGTNEVKVGRFTVTESQAKLSKGRLDGGSAMAGDIARPAQGPAQFAAHPPAADAAGQQGKATLAVMPFTYHRDARKAAPGTELETATLTQKFVTALVKTRKFDVVERARLDRLMDEMELSEVGLQDPARAVQAGKVLGADYMLMGEISVWTHTVEDRPIPRTQNRFNRRSEVRLIVDMRIVSSRTSRIASADKGDVALSWRDMFKGQPPAQQELTPVQLDEIQRELVDQLVRKTIDVVYPIKVIAVSGQAAAPPPAPRDRTPPVIRILAPRDGQALSQAPINVAVEVTDDGGPVARVTINGAAASQDEQGRYRARIGQPRDGANLVQVQATDAAGNVAEAASRFTFDSTPPEVQADATLLVEGTVDDLQSTLTINGMVVEFDRTTGRYAVRVPADPAAPGKVTIVATDAYGNATTEVRSVR